MKKLVVSSIILSTTIAALSSPPRQISGIYPHLAMYNNDSECGTGAVVPWADRLWIITYGPHFPKGSSSKLYEITPEFEQIVRPESIGGTPANRMIHRESKQLIIGPYFIDAERHVRTIPYQTMPGRHTGNARHLTDPANKVYFATMEEGLYEVDVHTLAVTCFIADGNRGCAIAPGITSQLPGYHGKGFYCGQGVLVYANNGERGNVQDPTIPSGALATWQGQGDWHMVRRNQFTEVTGPGGIYGNSHPDTDPIWSMGWDDRSLILMLLDRGQWHAYRLPKGSHSYDGSHGWNTEWPRIRDIGEQDLLATMHGTFWRFPRPFSRKNSAGIAPRSNYIKVIGDFCRWGDQLVMGCDDSAKSEFLNKRPFKSLHGASQQSNSNLWFMKPQRLDQLGAALGRGSVWRKEDVKRGAVSDPYLFAGYDRRMIHLAHQTPREVAFTLEVDKKGDNHWTPLQNIIVPAQGYTHYVFDKTETGAWIRLRAGRDAQQVTVSFYYSNQAPRKRTIPGIFKGIADTTTRNQTGGVMRGMGNNQRSLGLNAVHTASGKPQSLGYYELDGALNLTKMDNAANQKAVTAATPPKAVVEVDAASIIVVENGQRYRLPTYGPDRLAHPLGTTRICREVATERDFFNCQGIAYELPARNAQGFAKIRPVASHKLAIHDFCSYRGLLLISGLDRMASALGSDHIITSDDGKVSLWAGVVDNLWQLGKPRGEGGPWKEHSVQAQVPSDPYLMTAFDKKTVHLSHSHTQAVTITLEVDLDGTGLWVAYDRFKVESNKTVNHVFPDGYGAYWIRAISDTDCRASAWFIYE
jgi:hypothetical protein